jgi:D-alanyl-D-alanine carboxypeptidase/D-alanyl-D-alanine-endopeptidase (penicillin-binding protein 4)
MATVFSRLVALIAAIALSGAAPPAPAWSDADRADVLVRLEGVFSAPIFADAGIVVLDESGTPLFERNPDASLAPASTQKLLTATAALNVLTPSFRAITRFTALAPPERGTLDGPLWLVGGGDPYLTRDDLRNGVGRLSAGGLRVLSGPLVVDDSLFAGPEINPHWDPGDVDAGYAAPLSAIALDQGTVEVHVIGTADGEPARLSFLPKTDMVAVAQRPVTSAGASNVVDFMLDGSAKAHTYDITGSVTPGAVGKVWLPVRDLGRYAASAARTMLTDDGIRLQGGATTGLAPLVGVTLWEHRSPPLSEMLKETLVHSNNHAADTLLRVLGASGGEPGTDERGVAVVKAELAKLGIDTSGLRLYDGSGLSPANRVSALVLAQTVAAETRTPQAPVFIAALPLVGKEGTVKNRDVNDALGRARAKTGHLQGVDSLAGTVMTRHHGRVSFAFIKNGPDAWAGAVETAQDDAMEALADF